jgi:bacterioferritin
MADKYSGNTEERIDQFISELNCHSDIKMPEIKVEKKNMDYARLLYSAYADGEASELVAITQYLYHSQTIPIEEISDSIKCISLVEMQHLDTIGDLIKELGSKPFFFNSNEYFWSSGILAYVDKIHDKGEHDTSDRYIICLKLDMDIQGEVSAINQYELLYKNINDIYVRRILEKIISDEKTHIKIFQGLLEKYCRK